MAERNAEEIKEFVREVYSEIAKQQASSCCASHGSVATGCCASHGNADTSCCSGTEEATRAQRLYSEEELDALTTNIASLGCGNPVAVSELRPGDVVLDLGSGGGLDCFLAAQRVGPQGKVIGLDMTPEMIRQARANAKELSLENVEFRLGEMEHMPVESDSVDVVISNCVINLSPDKDAVFREVFRVLKAGGRLCVSDIVTHGELPTQVRESLEQWAGCVAGALEEQVYLGKIGAAGFVEPEVVGVGPPTCGGGTACGGNQIASITVKARKPK